MEARSPNLKPFPGKTKEKRPYGKAPLEFSLDVAIDAVNKIAREGKLLPESTLAMILGNTTSSSAFTRKVRALVSYGLLAEQPGAQFALTDLALAIALPKSPQVQAEAKKQAFLKIEQFNVLFTQHKGKILPAEEFLRNILEQEHNIPRDSSQTWAKQFKEGSRTAGLLYMRGDGKIQLTESPILDDSTPTLSDIESSETMASIRPSAPANDDAAQLATAESPRVAGPTSARSQQIATAGHCTRIDLSDGRRAEILIPDKLTSKDAKKLKKALEGVAVIIDSMISEEE